MWYSMLTHFQLPPARSELPSLALFSLEKSFTELRYLATASNQKFNFKENQVFNQFIDAILPGLSTKTFTTCLLPLPRRLSVSYF